MIKWLEIGADYVCNNRCVGCFSIGDGARMSTREVFATLRRGRGRGAEWLWLGGGDPTTRRDLFAVVAEARRLGYTRVKLQTNGMMLSYPEYTDRCADAGVTEVNFSIKGSSAEVHDRLTRTPGSFELMVRGMAQARRRGLAMDGDVLVYNSNLADVPAMVDVHAGHGVERFNLWLFSTLDQRDEDLAAEVPRIRDVVAVLAQVMALAAGRRSDFISSLHTPPCTLPAALSLAQFHSADLDLLVANPGGHAFRLETSPIEGGRYFDRCRRCDLRGRCGGARRDYVALYGDDEFQPVTSGAAPRRLPVLRDVVGLDGSETRSTR